jgi:outer membrane protein OmpA-like peptidoglycan-associated protein
MPLKKIAIIVSLLLASGPWQARAQIDDEDGTGLSRSMRNAVRFYEQGEDIKAMDHFMDILTKGAPSERSMANEYINLITHRMNSVGGQGGAPKPKIGVLEPINDDRPAAHRRAPRADDIDVAPPAAAVRRPARAEEPAGGNKAVMRKEIRARLRAAVDKSLGDMKSLEGVNVVMRENGDPEAIGVPSEMLFRAGIGFQPDAVKILDPLTRLVFALGTAQAVILPEGTALGDSKVLDMRRTMGISSHLFSAGVAPPRVRVNLLNTQVNMPKALMAFKGVVIVFVYNQPLNLVVESAIGDELGPPISLGVYPPSFRPARGQGAIVEFSVSEPSAGLVSWKFQLLQPSRDGAELGPLQDVVGGGPVFHQIFWNGKQNYFGETLPPGRYECVLTATDGKNRQRSVHRWIQILDEGPSEKLLDDKPAGAKAAASAPAATALAPSSDLTGAEEKPLVVGAAPAPRAVELKPRAAATRGKRRVAKRPARGRKPRTAKVKSESSDSSAPAATSGPWVLNFNSGTHDLTPAAERLLAQAAAAAAAKPRENLRVTGHCAENETDGAALAGQRAKMVAGILVNRHQIESGRIFMASSASGAGAKVELAFERTE